MEGGTNNKPEPVRLTIQCHNRPRNDSLSTCSSTPLSPWSTNSSASFFPSSSSGCQSSSLSPMSTSPPMSPMPRTPIPIDSPLFNNVPGESRRKRYKSFSRDIARRARSQKAVRDESVKKVLYADICCPLITSFNACVVEVSVLFSIHPKASHIFKDKET